jgi:hypothetical protein
MLKMISVKRKVVPALNLIKTYGVVEEWLQPFFNALCVCHLTVDRTSRHSALHKSLLTERNRTLDSSIFQPTV